MTEGGALVIENKKSPVPRDPIPSMDPMVCEIMLRDLDPAFEIVASAKLYSYSDDERNGYVANVEVIERRRGQGVGRELLYRCLEACCKRFHFNNVYLKVECRSWMQEWYQRNGFVECGLDLMYPCEEENMIWMGRSVVGYVRPA